MASRLLRGDRAATAQRLVWQNPALPEEVEPPPLTAPPPLPEPPPEPKPSPEELERQARLERERAEEERQRIRTIMAQQAKIQELERELEARPRQAYQQGYNEGQAAGIQQTNARLEPVIAKLAQGLKDLTTVRKRYLHESEEDAVRLALAVAKRVMHRELSVDPDSLMGVVRAAFDRVEARDIHRVRMHPEDAPILQKHLTNLGMPARLEIAPDPTLERGSVIVESSRGSLDASVSSQLLEIERGLVDVVRRSS